MAALTNKMTDSDETDDGDGVGDELRSLPAAADEFPDRGVFTWRPSDRTQPVQAPFTM